MPVLRNICSLVFLTLIYCASGYASGHFPFLGEISHGSVNVRAGANVNFEVVDKLTEGVEVLVLVKNYEWYKIELPLTSAAFVRADYIKVHDDSTGELLGDRVNVRARPNSESSTLGQMRKGAIVKLREKTGGWWRIEPPAGAAGWIHADFVRVKSLEVVVEKLRKPLSIDSVPVVLSALPVVIQGLLQPLAQAAGDVHYQIDVDGKSVYYLQDAPNLERFNRSAVLVEGDIVSGSNAAVPGPVLHINKITLVL